jgi:recombination protein RecR
MSDSLERLTALFERFPGIGPRQAGRFVQFLLRSSPSLRRDLAENIQSLSSAVHQCSDCYRYFVGSKTKCDICIRTDRDTSSLAVVSQDADLLALENSGTYRGYYFVLGGTVSLASEKGTGLRIRELNAKIKERLQAGLTEIILAFPANPEGDATAIKIREDINNSSDEAAIKITSLGRGLSTGSELEYADPETIKSAFEGRK